MFILWLRRASFRRNCYCFFAFPWESFSFGNHSTNVRYAKNTVKTVLEFAKLFFIGSSYQLLSFFCIKTEIFFFYVCCCGLSFDFLMTLEIDKLCQCPLLPLLPIPAPDCTAAFKKGKMAYLN